VGIFAARRLTKAFSNVGKFGARTMQTRPISSYKVNRTAAVHGASGGLGVFQAIAKACVLSLALVAASAAVGQSLPTQGRAIPSGRSTLEFPVSSSGDPLRAIARDTGNGKSVHHRQVKLMAAVATSSEIPVAEATRDQGSASLGDGLDAWMLILVGVFLVGYMSQRRLSAMTD
jgi:hypothetical protein